MSLCRACRQPWGWGSALGGRPGRCRWRCRCGPGQAPGAAPARPPLPQGPARRPHARCCSARRRGRRGRARARLRAGAGAAPAATDAPQRRSRREIGSPPVPSRPGAEALPPLPVLRQAEGTGEPGPSHGGGAWGGSRAPCPRSLPVLFHRRERASLS